MTLDFQTIVLLAGGFITLTTAIGLIIKGLRTGSGSAANGEKIDRLTTQVTALGERLQKLEDDFRHMPDAKSMHRVELAMQKQNGQLEVIEERLKPLAAISERLQEFLLSQGGK